MTSAAPGPAIGLFGASGTLGSRIARALAQAGIGARLFSRDPARLTARAPHMSVRADLGDPATLDAALAAVDTLILITADSPRQDAHGLAAIAAASRAGVSRVILVSAMLSSPGDDRQLGSQHFRIESALRASPMERVVIRPAFFMQSLQMVLPDLLKGRLVIPVPKARVAFVDADDVAEAVVRLTNDLELARSLPDPIILTGEQDMSFGDVAAALSRVSSTPIRHIAPPLWLAGLVLRRTEGAYFSRNMMFLFRGLNAGKEAGVSEHLRQILGRPATTFAQFAQREMRVLL